jgi:thiamine-monophosphate kinase
VSDGLVADLGHIAEASRVHIEVDLERIPVSPPMRRYRGPSARTAEDAACAGDDYEIVFTCPRAKAKKLADIARRSGVAVAEIGHVVRGRDVTGRDSDGRPIYFARPGYAHF